MARAIINTLIATNEIHYALCYVPLSIAHKHTPLVCGYCTNIFRIYDFTLLFTQRCTNKQKKRGQKNEHSRTHRIVSNQKCEHQTNSIRFNRSVSFYHVFCCTPLPFVFVLMLSSCVNMYVVCLLRGRICKPQAKNYVKIDMVQKPYCTISGCCFCCCCCEIYSECIHKSYHPHPHRIFTGLAIDYFWLSLLLLLLLFFCYSWGMLCASLI